MSSTIKLTCTKQNPDKPTTGTNKAGRAASLTKFIMTHSPYIVLNFLPSNSDF